MLKPKAFYTIRELSVMVDMSPNRTRRFLKGRGIRFTRVGEKGGRIMVALSELDEHLAEFRQSVKLAEISAMSPTLTAG